MPIFRIYNRRSVGGEMASIGYQRVAENAAYRA
jgi:hypothetical protein